MPKLCSFLLGGFLRVFFLCLGSFISILLITRIHEIAKFASLGTPISSVLLFTFLQVPYLLPIVIPLSALIAAFLFFQDISENGQLTALRSCGVSLPTILVPLMLTAFLMGSANFLIAGELTPRTRLKSTQMVSKITTSNPLFLLQKNLPIKLDMLAFDVGLLTPGKAAEDVTLVIKGRNKEPLSILSAKELRVEAERFSAKNLSLVTTVRKGPGFDSLLIENQEYTENLKESISHFLEGPELMHKPDYLPLSALYKKDSIKNSLSKSQIRKIQVETARRFSLSFGVITFTLLGIAFGISGVRMRNTRSFYAALLLITFYMACYLAAKTMNKNVLLVIFLYIIPHILLVFFSLKRLMAYQKGELC